MTIAANSYSKEDMNTAIALLREGKIICIHDDAGAWLVGDASNEEVALRLLKGKLSHLLIDHPSRLSSYVIEVPNTAWDLMEMSDKPLLLHLTGTKNLASSLSGHDKELRFRMATDKFSADLCSRVRKALLLCQCDAELEDSKTIAYRPRNKQKISQIRLDLRNCFEIIE